MKKKKKVKHNGKHNIKICCQRFPGFIERRRERENRKRRRKIHVGRDRRLSFLP